MSAVVIDRYLELGLRLDKHVDGFVDAYFGPPEIKERVAKEPATPPAQLADDARRLVADVEQSDLEANRRHFLHAQVLGLRTSAQKLAGDDISYSDEVERCYGVRPRRTPEDDIAEAHKALDKVLPGAGPLAERLNAWREQQVVPPDALRAVVTSLSEDLRERTDRLFGLPDGEHIDFDLVTNEPWSGFNYYLGGLRSRVAINTDLPVLSLTIAHLVAHEAYPGHHTEHTRKEVGLVRRRKQLEETIFLVGTPQCLIAEGLADLGLEVVVSSDPDARAEFTASHLAPLGVRYDTEAAATYARASKPMAGVRANAALLLHEDGADIDDVIAYLERWSLLPRKRAEKSVQFMTDPTWRAYTTCYDEGLPLCRAFVGGEPARFERLISEQLTPDQLTPAA